MRERPRRSVRDLREGETVTTVSLSIRSAIVGQEQMRRRAQQTQYCP